MSAKKETYAAIDIGSNAVRLLIKELENPAGPVFTKVQLVRVPLRLGFDVFSKGYITNHKKKDLVRLMKAYRHLMRIYDVDSFRACATSAMRDASNGKDIIADIAKTTGISIDIIDGKEEAAIIYGNHRRRRRKHGDQPHERRTSDIFLVIQHWNGEDAQFRRGRQGVGEA